MPDSYLHGYATEEQERLLAQAEHWRSELILSGTSLAPGTKLLEVGCGVGAVLGILGTTFTGVELAGVDIEQRQIDFARLHLAELGLEADLRQADARELPYPDCSFDHVWMMWFLEHLPDPLPALREARRVLVPGGSITAIEVDYGTVRASPSSTAFDAFFSALCRGMEAGGRSDAGTHLPGWLADAGFSSVDPGARLCSYSGAALPRQVAYVGVLLESVLASLADLPGVSEEELRAGLAHLRALPETPGARLEWVVHKSLATR